MAFLNDQDAAFVRKRLESEMDHAVRLVFFAPAAGGLSLPGEDAALSEYALQILKEVVALCDRVTLEEHSLASEGEVAEAFGISRVPATAIVGAEDYGIRLYGIPAGYEFVTLLDLIVDASKGKAPLSEETVSALRGLTQDAHLQVFVTPT